MNESRPSSESARRRRPRHAVGAGADDRAGLADRVVAQRPRQRAHERAALDPLAAQPALVVADQPADRQRRVDGVGDLDVVEHLAQRAELVEVAPQELRRRVVVRVQHAGVRVVDLRVAGLDHLAPEQLVLGVGDLAVGHLAPRRLGHAAVDVGEEAQPAREAPVGGHLRRAAAEPLDVDRAPPVAPGGEVALHLALDHVRGVGPRVVRAEHERDVGGLLEALQQRRQPAVVRGRRVLGEEGDVVALGQLHHAVAGAAVGEWTLLDPVHPRAVGGGDLERAVGRAGVDDQQLDLAVGALRAHRARAPRPGSAPR